MNGSKVKPRNFMTSFYRYQAILIERDLDGSLLLETPIPQTFATPEEALSSVGAKNLQVGHERIFSVEIRPQSIEGNPIQA